MAVIWRSSSRKESKNHDLDPSIVNYSWSVIQKSGHDPQGRPCVLNGKLKGILLGFSFHHGIQVALPPSWSWISVTIGRVCVHMWICAYVHNVWTDAIMQLSSEILFSLYQSNQFCPSGIKPQGSLVLNVQGYSVSAWGRHIPLTGEAWRSFA